MNAMTTTKQIRKILAEAIKMDKEAYKQENL